ncbi:MAG: helix-turn-helix transcriptional regulator [Acetatifactor sp.]|nr:helix-turn-helix transcriptional regulator [Acetatifactor sp.]
MDNKKTGSLIAQRRQELGLTQKELGEQLHVSDRAVSKWERAAGFPDMSLLEPLANALGVSVLDLIRGERLTPEEQPSPETERSVRTAVRELSGRLRQSLGRYRRLIIILTILLVAGAAVLAYQRFGPFQVYAVKEREVSAAEALEAVPHVIITVYDFAASQRLLNDPEVGGLLIPVMPDSESTLPPNMMDYHIAMDAEVADSYQELLRIGGQAVDGISVEVFYNIIVVSYSLENRHCILEIFYGGSIRKTAYTDKYVNSKPEVDGVVASNENNERFTISREEWSPGKK